MDFTIHTIETAPEASIEALAHAKETFGFIPNLEGIFAEAPALLQSSMALWDLFTTTSFSEIEQQVIYLTANYEHECHYYMAANTCRLSRFFLPCTPCNPCTPCLSPATIFKTYAVLTWQPIRG